MALTLIESPRSMIFLKFFPTRMCPLKMHPTIGELCAAKFVDEEWYRAKIEKMSGGDASVLYVDYGNR